VLVVDSWVSGLSPEGETEKNFSYKACVTRFWRPTWGIAMIIQQCKIALPQLMYQ